MEALLSLAFDNIASKELSKVSKGLRQIRAMLEQLCARDNPNPAPSSSCAARPSDSPCPSPSRAKEDAPPPPSPLALLEQDPAFREFFRLQELFEWNVATKIVSSLDRVRRIVDHSLTEAILNAGLCILQGCLLLHPPSRSIFEREEDMNLLISLIQPTSNSVAVQVEALSTLTCALLYRPRNIRVFEQTEGLRTIANLLNHLQIKLKNNPDQIPVVPFFSQTAAPSPARQPDSKPESTTADVQARLLEVIAVYLMDEPGCDTAQNELWSHRRSLSQNSVVPAPSFERQARSHTQKRRLLARQFSGIDIENIFIPSSNGLSYSSSSSSPNSSGLSEKGSPTIQKENLPVAQADSARKNSIGSSRETRGVDDTDASVTLVATTKANPTSGGAYSSFQSKKGIDLEVHVREKRSNTAGKVVVTMLEDEIRRLGFPFAT